MSRCDGLDLDEVDESSPNQLLHQFVERLINHEKYIILTASTTEALSLVEKINHRESRSTAPVHPNSVVSTTRDVNLSLTHAQLTVRPGSGDSTSARAVFLSLTLSHSLSRTRVVCERVSKTGRGAD